MLPSLKIGVLLVAALGLPTPTFAQLLRVPAFTELDAPDAKPFMVIDTKWGFVSQFNRALAQRLRQCGPQAGSSELRDLPELIELTPNRFGERAGAGVAQARRCGILPAMPVERETEVSSRDWGSLLPGKPLPTVLDRSKALAFRGAGRTADFDGVLLRRAVAPGANEGGPPVVHATLVWGPAAAVSDEGCYVQKILARYYATGEGRSRLTGVLTGASPLIPLLISDCTTQTKAALSAALVSADDSGDLRGYFADFAADPALRQIYQAAYLGPTGPWARRMVSFYEVYRRAHLKPTEIDFAFFLELARGSPLPADTDSPEIADFTARNYQSNAQARRAFFRLLKLRPESREFLLGRSVSYWIDASSEAALTQEERVAWVAHSRVKASDVGLSDIPYAACDVLQELAHCKKVASKKGEESKQ